MNEWADKIDEYLTGRLPEEERAAFETQVQLDPDLARDLAFTKELIQATGEADVLELRQKMSGIARTMPVVDQSGRSGKWYWALGVVVLLAGAIVFLWLRPGSESSPGAIPVPPAGLPPDHDPSAAGEVPVAQQQPKPTSPQNARNDHSLPAPRDTRYAALADAEYPPGYSVAKRGVGAPISGDNPYQHATAAYLGNNFEAVIDLLDTLPGGADVEIDALKLRAHAKFRQHLYVGAASDFELLARKSTFYHADAEWYRLLCFVAQWPATRDACTTQLDGMLQQEQPAHPFRGRALKLKERLAELSGR